VDQGSRKIDAPVDLDSPGVARLVSRKLLYDIDDFAIKTYGDDKRWHLGASIIGHDCSRFLWYTFRWCFKEEFNGSNDEEKHSNAGRMQRLWNRGHREEDRYVEFLKGIGAQVWTVDPQTGKQFKMSSVHGHYGGSMDGVIVLPQLYNITEPMLGEFKTNNTGKNFNDLLEGGVNATKPQHYIQMSCYGQKYNLRYCAYFNTNKNDDDLYIEIVKLNFNLATQMEAKAEKIITSQTPPPKLSENPTYWKCVYCPAKLVCHQNKKPESNCRACIHASPSINAEWHCNHWKALIPRDVVPVGCPQYYPLVNV